MNADAVPYRMACLVEAVKLTAAKSNTDETLAVADQLYAWLFGDDPKPATVSPLRVIE